MLGRKNIGRGRRTEGKRLIRQVEKKRIERIRTCGHDREDM